MVWYEHLLGILAIITCTGWLLVIAAIYVGAESDRPRTRSTKCRGHPIALRDHLPFAKSALTHAMAALSAVLKSAGSS